MSGTDFPDRSVRYSIYDYTTRTWNWTDPVHMQSGVNVFVERTGFGVIDDDSAGRVSVAANTGSGLVIARDAGPGQGIFDFLPLPGYYWPDMAIGDDGTYHVVMSSQSYALCYGRIRPGQGWDSILPLDSTAYAAYAIAAGKTAPFVCVTWVDTGHVFYVLSENRGDTWRSRTELDPPPAFGGDTVTKFSPYGLFPFLDSQGRLHIIAAVYPEVHDTAYSNPAEIWHWCPANQPHWAKIHHAGCGPAHLLAPVGYSAAYADRPSIGEGNDGRLYVAWEQFDSSNVEPQTSLLRAGIWVSSSRDNGTSWTPGLLVTARNTFSHRFPCIVDRMVIGTSEDTVCVLYLMDSVAGFFLQGQGPATPDPVICQFIPGPPSGVKERSKPQATSLQPMATIVHGVLYLAGAASRKPQASGLLDISGRKVLDLRPGANDVGHLSPGVYFVREAQAQAQATRKVVITR